MSEFWIKAIGAARSPLEDEWLAKENVVDGSLAASPRLAERVHFPRKKRPVGINAGDYFLLYGVTDVGGRIIGAGIFKSRFYEEDRAKELELRSPEDIAAWPWRMDIEMLLSVWHAHRGPTIDLIGLESVKMRRRSHLRLTEAQYRAGISALAEVAMPS
ncbi:MAG TPA: hypothetical protein VFY04_04270 [Solirubrobacterales bacterium]|nr:hypothetical protein [Solirubrobacterales bacterium]